MEGVEIQGRKLRVRRSEIRMIVSVDIINTFIFISSSKDTDKKKRPGDAGSDLRGEEKQKEILKKEDVKLHLISAFVSFLGREIESEISESDDRFRGLVDTARSALVTAYNLPEDESLKVPRNIEDIFFRDVRNDVKIEKPAAVEAKKEEVEQEEEDNDDDEGNWKRRGRDDDDDDETLNNDNGGDDQETELKEAGCDTGGSEEAFVNDLVNEGEFAQNVENDLLVNV